MKKTLIGLLKRGEQGQVLILALILLAVGSLIIVPLVVFMGTGLLAAQIVEEKANELYAADAGIEDAAQKIMNGYFDSLVVDGASSDPFDVTDINGLTTTVTVQKQALVSGFLYPSEYKEGQPHEDWVIFEVPPTELERNYEEGYVTYSSIINFHYPELIWDEDSGQWKETTKPIKCTGVGAIFLPWPGSETLIEGPSEINYTPVMTAEDLEGGYPALSVSAGSFAFLWKWGKGMNEGPVFTPDNRDGTLSFEFTVWDPEWEYDIYFIWATFQSQDISFITNAPGIFNWLVEATAGGTTVTSYLVGGPGMASILSYEID